MIWRPVLAGLDTLTNVEREWSLWDLLDSHESLDIREEAALHAAEQRK